MRQFAFISRHVPTGEQTAMAAAQNIKLIHVGDRDAFAITEGMCKEFVRDGFEGVVVVHPVAALMFAPHCKVGVFENGSRPVEGGPPQFFPKSLRVFDRGMNMHAQTYCQQAAKSLGGFVRYHNIQGGLHVLLSVQIGGRVYTTYRKTWEELASALGVLLDMA